MIFLGYVNLKEHKCSIDVRLAPCNSLIVKICLQGQAECKLMKVAEVGISRLPAVHNESQ